MADEDTDRGGLSGRTLAMASLMPVFPDEPEQVPPLREPGPRIVTIDPLARALRAVVLVKANVPKTARTAETLGTERGGHGVIVDAEGLVVTVGYLVMEATEVEVIDSGGRTLPAKVVAYDFATGFGLLRTTQPPRARPVTFGDSNRLKYKDQVIIAGHGGAKTARRVLVTDRRDFAGYWEYLLDNGIFTSPPYDSFGGAALLNDHGQLLGIGSLQVGDAWRGPSGTLPGNMFIPIDRLKPLIEALREGRQVGTPRPWLGLYAQQVPGELAIAYVSSDGPAERAGLRRGDSIKTVGGEAVDEVSDFYRKVWAAGPPGTRIVLGIEREGDEFDVTLRSVDRMQYLRIETGS